VSIKIQGSYVMYCQHGASNHLIHLKGVLLNMRHKFPINKMRKFKAVLLPPTYLHIYNNVTWCFNIILLGVRIEVYKNTRLCFST
jgi:hypothetical protein